MSETENASAAGRGEIDFDRAEFDTGTEGAPRVTCTACSGEIVDRYFTRDGELVCARCEGPARRAGVGGTAFGRFLGALAAGLVAATLASALWMLVTRWTGYEIGLIAIAVGWIVGLAVMVGCRGIGGLPYQLLAVFLSYSAIVMTYVPLLLAQLERPTIDAWRVIPIAYAVPFLTGFENAIGLLIIAFGLYQAWMMTRRQTPDWQGPFALGQEASGGIAPAPGRGG